MNNAHDKCTPSPQPNPIPIEGYGALAAGDKLLFLQKVATLAYHSASFMDQVLDLMKAYEAQSPVSRRTIQRVLFDPTLKLLFTKTDSL